MRAPHGVLWLAAAVLILTAVVLLFAAPGWFWLVGVAGLVVSQIAIVGSRGDERFCTIANVVLLAAVVFGTFARGPFGLRAEDGKTTHPQRWSTPMRNSRATGPYRLATRGEGRYAAPDGEHASIELELNEVGTEAVSYNGGSR